ncbi:MAG: beta-ketoacyl-[acyl-carrier-protein] synthase family protein [Betaproteobacteria bacterium]
MRKVVVTGIGVVSPLGNGREAFFESLAAGRSGIRRLSAGIAPRLATQIGGVVDFDPAAFPKPKLALLDRFSQFALAAAAEALGDAGIGADDPRKANAGVYMGSGFGGALTIEAAYNELFTNGADRLGPYTVVRVMNNAAAAHISIDFGLHGPSLTYSTACSSGAVALGEAARAIRHGYADLAVAGGAESLLTLATIRAWEGLRALASEDPADASASCRPFSRDRTGLVLGEGAGVMVLESEEGARERGAAIYAELAGYGVTSDATHLTKPSLSGQVAAMRMALADAGLEPGAVGYINAHGTATLAGDAIETAAIKEVFGAHARRLAVSSTKSMHGHLMGATGAVEFIAAILALQRGTLPPTANLRVPDPECDLDYVANVARRGAELEAVMSNSFAFGGSNAVLVARRA